MDREYRERMEAYKFRDVVLLPREKRWNWFAKEIIASNPSIQDLESFFYFERRRIPMEKYRYAVTKLWKLYNEANSQPWKKAEIKIPVFFPAVLPKK